MAKNQKEILASLQKARELAEQALILLDWDTDILWDLVCSVSYQKEQLERISLRVEERNKQ